MILVSVLRYVPYLEKTHFMSLTKKLYLVTLVTFTFFEHMHMQVCLKQIQGFRNKTKSYLFSIENFPKNSNSF